MYPIILFLCESMYPIILTQPHGQARSSIVRKRSQCAHVPYDDRVLGTMDMIINNNGAYIQWSPTSRYVYIIWYQNCVFTKFTSIFRCTFGIYWQDFLYTRTPKFRYIINYFHANRAQILVPPQALETSGPAVAWSSTATQATWWETV
jgi:hypothetical protein